MVLVRALKKVMREQRVRSSTGTGTAPTAPAGDARDSATGSTRRPRSARGGLILANPH